MIHKVVQNPHSEKFSSPKNRMKRLSLFFATGFFVGYIPVAPGTFGTLLGLVIFAITGLLKLKLQIILFVFYFLIAFPATRNAIKHFGKLDPPQVVIDEILGIWLTLLFFDISFKNLLWGFVFFRLFDILKPFPVGYIDKRLKGEVGVILDDVAAGLMSKGLIWILFYR